MITRQSNQFLYSQDLSNYKTTTFTSAAIAWFLYSQDLSNYKTRLRSQNTRPWFLYSQDLSNYKTLPEIDKDLTRFCTLKI